MGKNIIKLKFKDGKEMKVPEDMVEEVNIPNVLIQRSFYHLKLKISEKEKQINKILRKR